MTIMKTKICTGIHGCGKQKPISEFSKDKSRKDGLCPYCKDCKKENYQKNKKKILNNKKEYYKKNKSIIKHQANQYRDKNKEKIKINGDIYYQKNRKNILQKKRQYWVDNKSELLKKKNVYRKNRLKNDINFKISYNLRSRLTIALNGKDKALSTMFLIGCDIDYLMYYIQEKFTKGMSWDNHGFCGWHMDHIKPCASFDLSKKSEQLKCFNFKNLQPLWAEDNRRKGSK